ncbi:MAG: FAD-binding protein, partial [Rikenellaceae bacterium]|nr:FAD-binding protein [Rikenellaceae bacterium]
MTFDTIIIGGGLSGLITGISLSKMGQKCLIISLGQSALHFFSGSFELYGCEGNPLEAIARLDFSHPYGKLGVDTVKSLAERVPALFEQMNITLRGSAEKNHYRMTPLGLLKPAWLTVDEYLRVESPSKMPYKRVAILNIEHFLDFHPEFMASGLA